MLFVCSKLLPVESLKSLFCDATVEIKIKSRLVVLAIFMVCFIFSLSFSFMFCGS